MFKPKIFKSPVYLILFMIIVLLLILLFTNYGKADVLMPTGNIDIFDIIIENNRECDGCETPVFSEDEKNGDGLSIFDEKGNFDNQKELNIFSNPAFEMKPIIAPGSSNAYQFVIRNNNSFNIQYSIKMNETSKYNINMKYRLKQDGNYIIGNDNTWVTANKLIVEKVNLASKSNMPYILEWKWFESNHDTEIGKLDTANYKLSIQVVANSI